MFSTDLMESKQDRVAINGVEPHMIGMLVQYAYTSDVFISKANVQVNPDNVWLSLTSRGSCVCVCTLSVSGAAGPAGSRQPAGREGRTRRVLSLHGASDGRDELRGHPLLRRGSLLYDAGEEEHGLHPGTLHHRASAGERL